ncbi:MAG: type sorting protein [Ignavibacteria bacterium]|nr:type sorting protein [Ignavibacteria bacterium]
MKKFLLLCNISLLIICSWLGAAIPISGPTEYIPQAFKVLNYSAVLDLMKSPSKVMSGVCRTKFVWTELPDTNYFYFHLRDLTVDSVFYNNTKTTAEETFPKTNPNHYYRISPIGSAINDTDIVTVFYHGTMTNEGGSMNWGGVQSDDSVLYALGVGFNCPYVSTTRHWLPCYDHPSMKATFDLKFYLLQDKSCASIGTCTIDTLGKDTVVYHWKTNYPTSTYLVTFAVSNFKIRESKYKELPLVWYSRNGDTSATDYEINLLPKMLTFLEGKFGPYPFEKVGYVNTKKGSMESQTMINIDSKVVQNYYKNKDSISSVTLHELAHQWFGDMVTCQDFRDAWLNEGFAEYCESLWVGSMDNFTISPKYLDQQSKVIDDYINKVLPQEGALPLYDFPRQAPSSNYPTTIYYKGAAVLGMLRYEIGDSIFFSSLKEYLNKFKYSCSTTWDLKNIFEKNSKRNLDTFFQQWVYRKGIPILDVEIKFTTYTPFLGTINVKIKQVQPSEYGYYSGLLLPISYSISDSESLDPGKVILRIDKPEQEYVFDSLPIYSDSKFVINKDNRFRTLVKINKLTITNVDEDIVHQNINPVIYPNPANDKALLSTFTNEVGTAEIAIFNIYGIEVLKLVQLMDGTSKTINIDTSLIPSGFYFAKLTVNNSSDVVNFTVIH